MEVPGGYNGLSSEGSNTIMGSPGAGESSGSTEGHVDPKKVSKSTKKSRSKDKFQALINDMGQEMVGRIRKMTRKERRPVLAAFCKNHSKTTVEK